MAAETIRDLMFFVVYCVMLTFAVNVNDVHNKTLEFGSRNICGSGWQQHYANIHTSTARLLEVTPPSQWEKVLDANGMRMIVALVREGKYEGQYSGGIGDRFTGLITVFALALLNDVPFFLDFPRLSDVFPPQKSIIAWSLNIEDYIEHKKYINVKTSFLFWRQKQLVERAKSMMASLNSATSLNKACGAVSSKCENISSIENIKNMEKLKKKKQIKSNIKNERKRISSLLHGMSGSSTVLSERKVAKSDGRVGRKSAPNRRSGHESRLLIAEENRLKAAEDRLKAEEDRFYVVVNTSTREVKEGLIDDPEKFTKENQYRIEYLLNTRTITVARNTKGFIMQLFKENKYSKKMKEWGFNRENMYGCLFDYLFRPSDALRRNFQREIDALSRPDTLKILLQIRAGDSQIGKGIGRLSRDTRAMNLASAFFECAARVEAMALKNASSASSSVVIWYLMTDSEAIKQYARDTYGNKVIMHNSRIVNMLENQKGYNFRAFSDVIGEQWCGSLCDYFITSTFSGLGMQAAFRSKIVTGRVYPINNRIFDSQSKDKRKHNGLQFLRDSSSLASRSDSSMYITLDQLCNAETTEVYGERYSAI